MGVNEDALAAMRAIARQPLQQQLEFLVTPFMTGQVLKAPWDTGPAVWSQGLAGVYLQRLAIEGAAKLTAETSRLTKWLIALTWALVLMTAVLVVLTTVLVIGPSWVRLGLNMLRWLFAALGRP